jgi:quinol-cytochrome oxidoreductase complex cytochrome b subunit
VDDKQDYDPLDPKVTTEPSEMPWTLIIIVIVIVIVIIISIVSFIKKKRKGKS